MYLSVISDQLNRVIQHSFDHLLLGRGYEQNEGQFYVQSGWICKLVIIRRDLDHTHFRQVAIFTIDAYSISEDVWQLINPNRTLLLVPFK